MASLPIPLPTAAWRAMGLALAISCSAFAAPAPLEVLEDEPVKPALAAPVKPKADSLRPADAAKASAAAPADTSESAAPMDTAKSGVAAAPVLPAPAAVAMPPADTLAPSAITAPEPSPDPGAITVEVDPGQSVNKDKSLALAMLYSAALPGSGELYLREKTNAKAFLLAEAGFWASLYVAFLARESYLTSARNYASEYAGIDASGKSAAFLETMASFRSYQEKQHRQDSYEIAQILSGKRDRDYPIKPIEANYWDFGSSANPGNTENWKTFQSTLRYYRASKVAMSFAIGALALNRLASLANTLRVYKRTSSKGLGLNFTPEFGPESVGSRLTLGF